MTRKILHLDLDAFFCSVEELENPALRGKAFAVGGLPGERGVVSSCSYPARVFGVRSAMPMGRAIKLCPELIVVSGRHGDYGVYSERVMEIIGERTAMIEQISIDEAFIDLTDLPQSGEELARGLQTAIRERLGLPCSIGVASNKLVAKIATNVGKSRHRGPGTPCAITVVPPGGEAAFLAPLAVDELWGVGPKTAAQLREIGLHTIGDIVNLPGDHLADRFGVIGRDLWLRAQGIDERPVSTEYMVKSISQEITFEKDITDQERLRKTLRWMSEKVAFRLRSGGLTAATVRIKLRWADFTTITRQVGLKQPADQDNVIYAAALGLFEQAWDGERPVRLLGVGASRLSEAVYQLGLWDTPDQKERRLLEALDALREKFGEKVVKRGG